VVGCLSGDQNDGGNVKENSGGSANKSDEGNANKNGGQNMNKSKSIDENVDVIYGANVNANGTQSVFYSHGVLPLFR
jgi:hypothetical protein